MLPCPGCAVQMCMAVNWIALITSLLRFFVVDNSIFPPLCLSILRISFCLLANIHGIHSRLFPPRNILTSRETNCNKRTKINNQTKKEKRKESYFPREKSLIILDSRTNKSLFSPLRIRSSFFFSLFIYRVLYVYCIGRSRVSCRGSNSTKLFDVILRTLTVL